MPTRILLASTTAPWPADNGARQRTNLLHRGLSRCGQVDCVVVSPIGVAPDEAQQQELTRSYGFRGSLRGRGLRERPPWPSLAGIVGRKPAGLLASLLRGWGTEYDADPAARAWLTQATDGADYDLVVSRYLWPAAHLGMRGSRGLMVDVDDLESQRLASFVVEQGMTGARAAWWRRRVAQTRAAERRLLARADHVWLAKAQDADRLELGATSLLPNVPYARPGAAVQPFPQEPASREVLFVGTLEYGPNVRAMQRFIDRVWPQVRAAHGDAALRVVGGGLSAELAGRWSAVPGVELLGFASELAEPYRRAAISIVPIWEGAGTKIKLLESLRFGRTGVAAAHSMLGYEDHLRHGEHVWVARDDAGMAEGCIALLGDPARRAAMAGAGCRQVEAHYSVDAFLHEVQRSVECVLTRADDGRGA